MIDAGLPAENREEIHCVWIICVEENKPPLMEDSVIYVLLGIISLAILALYHNRRSKTPYIIKDGRLYKLPPGSMGWPLIGETFDYYLNLKSTFHPQKFIADRQRRYGDIFSSHLFGRPVVVSVNPDVNRFVMQNEGRLFQAQYPRSFLDMIGKYGLLGLHGDLQRKSHGVAANLLSPDKLRTHFIDDIQALFINAMANWHGKEIKLHEECHQILLHLMAKQLLDLSPSNETEEIGRQFFNFTQAILSVPVQIPGSTYAKGIKARNYLIKKIYQIMDERKKQPQVVHNDLLAKYLTEEPVLSDEFIADSLLFLLFAGHETTSTVMALSIKYLTDCPRALKQLREEHESLLTAKGQDNQNVTWADYKSMKFTQCVINEALRIGNVALFLSRKAKKDVNIGGYEIPEGSNLELFISAVHTDEKNYSDPLEFNPWRWETCNKDFSINPSLTPFGGGGRLCPGANLAMLEISLFLHHFVTKFRWNSFKHDKISCFPLPNFPNGLPIQVNLRQ